VVFVIWLPFASKIDLIGKYVFSKIKNLCFYDMLKAEWCPEITGEKNIDNFNGPW